MIIETSALVAILRNEPEARRFAQAIKGAKGSRLSAAWYVELRVAIDRTHDPVAARTSPTPWLADPRRATAPET